MIPLEKIDQTLKLLKEFKKQRVKFEKLSDKLCNAGLADITIKRRENMTADLNWQAMEIDKSLKLLYRSMLEFKCSLGEREYNPSSFHRYKG